jgi:hypothetical protein
VAGLTHGRKRWDGGPAAGGGSRVRVLFIYFYVPVSTAVLLKFLVPRRKAAGVGGGRSHKSEAKEAKTNEKISSQRQNIFGETNFQGALESSRESPRRGPGKLAENYGAREALDKLLLNDARGKAHTRAPTRILDLADPPAAPPAHQFGPPFISARARASSPQLADSILRGDRGQI